MRILIFIGICVFNTILCAEERIGYYYEVGKKTEKPIFTQKSKVVVTQVARVVTGVVEDSAGKVIMTETATFEKNKLIKQNVEQYQIDESYELTIENSTAKFVTYNIADRQRPIKKDEATQKIDEYFVTGPSLEVYLSDRLVNLDATLKKPVDFAIFELQKSLSFEIKRTKKLFSDLTDTIPLRLTIKSFFISLFADPLYLEIDPKTAMLMRYRGRTPLKILKNNKLVPFDADIYYEVVK